MPEPDVIVALIEFTGEYFEVSSVRPEGGDFLQYGGYYLRFDPNPGRQLPEIDEKKIAEIVDRIRREAEVAKELDNLSTSRRQAYAPLIEEFGDLAGFAYAELIQPKRRTTSSLFRTEESFQAAKKRFIGG